MLIFITRRERRFFSMETNSIVTLISSVGFPIVACLGMAWYVKYQMDNYAKQIKELRDEHNKEIDKVTEALNNNTLAIQRLCDKMEK